MKIKANGISINYQVDGPDGAPWLVLSNSLATNLAMWDDQARELDRAFRVLRYDQRGHGTTEAPAGRYAFELLIADALALMDALAIKRAHFGGLSMGGATALGLAQKHPDRLDRVIVCDSPCQSTPTSSQQWEERIVVAQRQGMEALVEPTLARWFPPEAIKVNPPHLDKVRQMIRTTPVNGFIGCAAALADHNYAAAVATVTRRSWSARRTPRRRPCASSTKRCPARVTWSFPAPGTFPTSTSLRLSPAPLRISWPPNDGPAAPACRCVDCKVSGRGAIPLSSGSTLDQAPPSHFEALGLSANGTPPRYVTAKSQGDHVMTAVAAATQKKQVPLSNKAREMMEAINVDAAKHHVWVRTQANAPAQRPWFSATGGEGSGQLASGRVAANQMKTIPYMWRWSEFSPYLHRISEIARKAEVSPIEFADRQSILLLNPGLNGRLQVTNTIRCAISIYNPGDVAPVHLHSPNASRTILSDKGG